MPRLLHSNAGFVRSMQMSSKQVFVFVEGKQTDSFFYGGICDAIDSPKFTFEICLAQQLPSTSGGKQSLLTFFSYLRRNKKLLSDLCGNRTSVIFYLDKDVDDIQHTLKRSKHIVYTEYYDVQNYVFEYGDLIKGAAAAASINPTKLSQLADGVCWCKWASQNWRDWVVLCLFMLKKQIPCEANYARPSPIHRRYCGPVDSTAHFAILAALQTRTGLALNAFDQELATIAKRVDWYYQQGKHHCIFKGKWFATILSDQIDQIMSGNPYDINNLANRLPCTIATTLDFRGAWAEHFKAPLRHILKNL